LLPQPLSVFAAFVTVPCGCAQLILLKLGLTRQQSRLNLVSSFTAAELSFKVELQASWQVLQLS